MRSGWGEFGGKVLGHPGRDADLGEGDLDASGVDPDLQRHRAPGATGFLPRRIPLLRRTITGVPAVNLLAVGADPTAALVCSQVVLSSGIPFALVPLVWLTARRSVMGPWVDQRTTTPTACVVAGAVIALYGRLVVDLLS